MASESASGPSRHVIPVRHFAENPPARSEGKRIMTGMDAYEEVTLDFQDTESIGPSFADEVFRVFANQHPDTKISG